MLRCFEISSVSLGICSYFFGKVALFIGKLSLELGELGWYLVIEFEPWNHKFFNFLITFCNINR